MEQIFKMPIQANLQWTDFLLCPICQHDFTLQRSPISLGCGHTICKLCLATLHRKQCPFDQTAIISDIDYLPVNSAILQLINCAGENKDSAPKSPSPSTSKLNSEAENLDETSDKQDVDTKDDTSIKEKTEPVVPSSVQKLSEEDLKYYNEAKTAIEELALYLKPYINGSTGNLLSRPMIRKLVTLVNCQLMEDEGKIRSLRAARSLGERTVTELILQHQNPQQLSTNLWAAVRARGCQFLGPAMQEEVLKLVLLALEDGSALSRKVLVMFVVQRLEPHFHQASKTSIGHVVQLLYRASCFKVSKREGDSSLMQLKEEYRTYEALRREHDAQIVQIATEAGLRIAPDQWSSLLYGDTAHKSHMQSIIDKLQTPQSFEQSVQELVIALQRTGDPANLSGLRTQLKHLAGIDPVSESTIPTLKECATTLDAVRHVVQGLVEFVQQHGNRKLQDTSHVLQNSKYKISFCRDLKIRGTCPRAGNCTFAHSEDELERYRAKVKKLPLRATASTPKETIEYLGEPIGRSGSFGEEHSPMRYAKNQAGTRFGHVNDNKVPGGGGGAMGSHPPLLPHLSLPANPAAMYNASPPGPMMSPQQMNNRFPPVIPPPPTPYNTDPNNFVNPNYMQQQQQQRPPIPPNNPLLANIRNFRPPSSSYGMQPPPPPPPHLNNNNNNNSNPQLPPNMYGNKMPLAASPSAPPQYVNEFYNNLMQQQMHPQSSDGVFSQANPFLKQLQNAHEYPLDKLDQRKLELIRQIIEWEQQAVSQQQKAPQIPNKIPVKSTQSLPMFRTSPTHLLNMAKESNATNNMAMQLHSLINRRREIMQEIETNKEIFGNNDIQYQSQQHQNNYTNVMHDQINGNIYSNPSKKHELLDYWGFASNSQNANPQSSATSNVTQNLPSSSSSMNQHHHHASPSMYQIDTSGATGSTNKDTFVRSDSILDDDYVPFEQTTTTSCNKFGPISRMPSNPLKQQQSLTGLDTLLNGSKSLTELAALADQHRQLHDNSPNIDTNWLHANNNNNNSSTTSPSNLNNLFNNNNNNNNNNSNSTITSTNSSNSTSSTVNHHITTSTTVQDAIIKLMSPTVTVSNNNNNNNNNLSSTESNLNKLLDVSSALYLKRLSDNNQLQMELSRVDHKIAGLRQTQSLQGKAAVIQEHQQQQQQLNQQQQPAQIPQKRKLTRLVGGLVPSDLHNPLAKANSFSSGQVSSLAATRSTSNQLPSSSSSSLFWNNETDLINAKLWGTNADATSAQSSSKSANQ
uniref:RING-type E3 ubiquitin transferase n=1 Tax=Culicoides sonorensis TaxID=179676 RepID=A0A336MTQ1_CULSO